MLNHSESLAEKFIKKGFWLYLFSFLIGPLGYFIKIILSNDLGVEEIGLLYGVISFVGLLGVYHDLGLTESLNYFLPKFMVKHDWIRFKSLVTYSLLAQLITSSLIGTVLFLSSSYLWGHYFHTDEAVQIIRIFCLFFLGMNLLNMCTTIFQVSQNTKLQKGTEFVRMTSVLLFTIGLHFTNTGNLISYTWTWIEWVAIGVIFGGIFFYRCYYVPYLRDVSAIYDTILVKEVVKYALWVMFAANVGTILGQVDMQLIIYLLGPRDAGYYTNYLSLIGIPFIIITPIISFLFPVVSELHGKEDTSKIRSIKTMFYKYFSIIAIITSVFLFVFGPEISVIFFGDKFAMSGTILQYSAPFLILNFLMQINFQILAGVGRVRERVKILGVGLIFNVILNLVFIHFMGVVGSALAVGASWIPIWYLSDRATREYSHGFDIAFFLKNLVLSGIIGSGYWYYLPSIVANMNRVYGLVFLSILAILTMIPFVLVNKTELRMFILELKKMRK